MLINDGWNGPVKSRSKAAITYLNIIIIKSRK